MHNTPPASVTVTRDEPLTAAALPDDAETLKRMILELLATLQQAHRDRDALQHRLDVLLRRLYGPRGEHFDPNQPWLFGDAAETPATDNQQTEPEQTETARTRRRRAKPHGRRRLPDKLERRPVHHQLSEAERRCSCGQVRVDIGVDVSEQLDYKPASLFVWQHFIHKYACPHCARKASLSDATATAVVGAEAAPAVGAAPASVATPTDTDASASASPAPAPVVDLSLSSGPVVIAAAKPAMPIAKGLPGAGLLADIIVNKYLDHLPLYRQERRYERQGVLLPRSTTCAWMAACADVLRPLYQRMVEVVLASQVIHTDDTPIKIQDPAPGAMSTGRLWVYLGDAAHPYNVFDFTPNHKRDGPQQFLTRFQGYLQADAFGGYDCLYLPQPSDGQRRILEVACNAHARRKFYEARGSDAARAHQALAYYSQLYEIERRAKEANADDGLRLRLRQDLAVPILERFHTWLQAQRADVLPKSPLAEALGYALNNWTALVRYTDAGFLAIDNNWAEREMKRIAIGRKNWLFVGSPRGGQTAAVLFSFTSTCQRLGVEPWAYLQDVLTRLPTTAAGQLGALLPDRWQAAPAAAAEA